MHRFFPGVLFLQFLSLLVFWLNLPKDEGSSGLGLLVPDTTLLLRVGIPVVLIGLVGAFWFSAISRHASERAVVRLKDSHAKEREKIKVSAERDRTRMVKETQKEIQKQSRRASGKANLKVGLAFAGAAVAGVVMIFIELITFGMMTMTTAGGALGGYLLRGKKPKPVAATGAPTLAESDLALEDTAPESIDPEGATVAPALLEQRSVEQTPEHSQGRANEPRVVNPQED